MGAQRHNHVPVNGAGRLRHNRIINTSKYLIVRDCHCHCHSDCCTNRVGEQQACGIYPEIDSAAIASCRETDPSPGTAKSRAATSYGRAATSYGRAATGHHNGRLLPDQQ